MAQAPADRQVIVRTIDLKKHYTKKGVVTEALRGVTIEIWRGEMLCVMGPSGSGKSTFFNMIGGLDAPTAGRVFIDEVDVAQLNAYELAYLRCKKVGYVFQSYNLIPVMTALENVTTPMIFAGVEPDEARKRGMRLLDLVGIGERWFHRPKEMSGGQQQRIAIARAMANSPSMLLCDEPTANLDQVTGQEICEILERLRDERGVTIVCATHDHKFLKVSDRIAWIRDGEVSRLVRSEDVEIEVGHIG
jgi:putative ABC transport system ATP-binding protein